MSKVFAIVENNKVVNIALSETALADNWIQSDEAQIGWDYDGSKFTQPPDPTPTAEEVFTERNRLLAESDWTQLSDARAAMGEAKAAEWDAYRQALRDVQEQEGFPENVVWPTKPE
jgi:hypothetical protein